MCTYLNIFSYIMFSAPFTTDWLGTSPLHLAARFNHYDTCQVLLRAGISKDSKTKVDRTPLHLAVYEGNGNIVQLLLNSNVDIEAKDMVSFYFNINNELKRKFSTLKRVNLIGTQNFMIFVQC